MDYVNTKENYRGHYLDGMNRFSISVNSNFSEPVQAGIHAQFGPHIARYEDPPVLGDGLNYTGWIDIKPTSRMMITQSYRYSSLKRQDTGEELFSGYIYRGRMNYQFTRELYLRLIVQYNDFSQNLSIEPLLSYELNPFSIFYIGSGHNYGEIGDPSEFTQTSRQFFLKFQYLFRM